MKHNIFQRHHEPDPYERDILELQEATHQFFVLYRDITGEPHPDSIHYGLPASSAVVDYDPVTLARPFTPTEPYHRPSAESVIESITQVEAADTARLQMAHGVRQMTTTDRIQE